MIKHVLKIFFYKNSLNLHGSQNDNDKNVTGIDVISWESIWSENNGTVWNENMWRSFIENAFDWNSIQLYLYAASNRTNGNKKKKKTNHATLLYICESAPLDFANFIKPLFLFI